MKPLSKHDTMRVTAADVLTPEVLSPMQGTDYTARFHEMSDQLLRQLGAFTQQVKQYTPRVTNRTEMWRVTKLFYQSHEELENYIRAMRKLEEEWEDEEHSNGDIEIR